MVLIPAYAMLFSSDICFTRGGINLSKVNQNLNAHLVLKNMDSIKLNTLILPIVLISEKKNQ